MRAFRRMNIHVPQIAIHVRQMAKNTVELRISLPPETLAIGAFWGEDPVMNIQGTAISLDSESQATEIAPTEGIRKSACGPFVLCR